MDYYRISIPTNHPSINLFLATLTAFSRPKALAIKLAPKPSVASSSAKPDIGQLRQIVLANTNIDDLNLDGDILLVFVLQHDKSPQPCQAEDFLSLKVKTKHHVSKVNSAYLKTRMMDNVNFKHMGKIIGDEVKTGSFLASGDKVVIFTAHDTSIEDTTPSSSTSSQIRRPLELINNQLRAAPNLHAAGGKPTIKTEVSYTPPYEDNHLSSIPTTSQNAPGQGLSHAKFEQAPMTNVPQPVKAEQGTQDTPMQDVESSEESNLSQLNSRLQKLIEGASTDELEAEVRSTQAFLVSLRKPLDEHAAQSQDAQHWVQQISNLQKHDINAPTIIGVVGNTGAEKSSVINAILDEERLVPTNCMRACTADCTTADSEAGIAYAKIQAVYPQNTKDMLAHCTVEQLMNEPDVKAVLGTTKKIEQSRPYIFYRGLQHYVNSKEKSTGDKKKKKEKGEKKPMGF
ncbi:hypothetical protein G7Y89_g1738 [Cudoniella acicularis]|uniref:G domain-containing protein n=1 Tax=Cudoniella acicularis TaxID=354080 RepID=A0A8H4RVS0_9HELO|nr:hypothetical protein G7Y89_g1738 [Cudoniella acicularis]